jgi:hypothetical protein
MKALSDSDPGCPVLGSGPINFLAVSRNAGGVGGAAIDDFAFRAADAPYQAVFSASHGIARVDDRQVVGGILACD